MKLLLCSDFSNVGYRWVKRFFKSTKGLNVLFVGYAKEDDTQDDTQSGSYERFVEMGMSVDVLDKNYKFDKTIDIIFVRGGNTTKLIHYLKKYDQFDKIKTIAEKGRTLYWQQCRGYFGWHRDRIYIRFRTLCR